MKIMDKDEWYDLKYQLETGDITEDNLDEYELEALSHDDWTGHVQDIIPPVTKERVVFKPENRREALRLTKENFDELKAKFSALTEEEQLAAGYHTYDIYLSLRKIPTYTSNGVVVRENPPVSEDRWQQLYLEWYHTVPKILRYSNSYQEYNDYWWEEYQRKF